MYNLDTTIFFLKWNIHFSEVVDERAIKRIGEMWAWRSKIGLGNYELFGYK